MRLGAKTCPKVINFLLAKQLENTMSPLPNHAGAAGDKTAMRVNQGFVALAEGETLSVDFLFILIWYINAYHILGQNKAIQILPMRSVLLILLFSVLDCIQDIIASTTSSKFSNWSYLFDKSHEKSWHSKKNWIFWWVIYMKWNAFVCFTGGSIKCKLTASDDGMIPSPTTFDFVCPDYSQIHL